MQRILAQMGGLAKGGAQASTEKLIVELNERSREIFRRVVESYLETGEPVGSRAIARRLSENLSPATIRNVMSDLQDLGLLFAPHTSAGRLPTDVGLRLFVNGLLEVGHLSGDERAAIDARCASIGRSVGDVLEHKSERPLKHIEFVNLGPGRALVVMVNSVGAVENRIIEVPLGVSPSALIEATNYLNSRLSGKTLEEARETILAELKEQRATLDSLTQRVVELGLATWAGDASSSLIVRGQSRLLEDVTALEDLEAIRTLFEALERGETFMKLVDLANSAEGVQIFIGADNPLFGNAGCSVVIAPFTDGRDKIVGAIGVVGPTRLNYARIIPLVDYTAKVIGRIVG
jgi:heat-inducible transcriptional repressor